MLVFFRLWSHLWQVSILCLSFSVNVQTPSIQLPPVQLALIEGMSGPFANSGEAVLRNLVWAVERVDVRGGVTTQEGKRRLVLNRYETLRSHKKNAIFGTLDLMYTPICE